MTDDLLTRPVRIQLHHVPPFRLRAGSTFFITVCCRDRRHPQLNRLATFGILRDTALRYEALDRWCILSLVAMPDHLHMLAGFRSIPSMAGVVGNWKRYVSRVAAIQWQKGFFEHRIRSQKALETTWRYMEENPVRKGLCNEAAEWPWRWSGVEGQITRFLDL